MPVVKIFASDAFPATSALAVDGLYDAIAASCVQVLRASPAQIQIMLIPVKPVRHGEDIYAEVNFRSTEFRQTEVVQTFMQSLEQAVVSCFDTLPRIRCFAEDQAALYARN